MNKTPQERGLERAQMILAFADDDEKLSFSKTGLVSALAVSFANYEKKLEDSVALTREAIDVALARYKLLDIQIQQLTDGLRLIQAMAGHPDAAQGCRNIIKKAEELIDEFGYEEGNV